MVNIVFFGNEKLATGISSKGRTLDMLVENGYKIAQIYTKSKADFNRSDIPISTSTDLEEISRQLHELRPDIGVLVAYGVIIPKNIIDIFPYGIINIHPSLLPKGRGPAPIEEVILDGNKRTGVSIMQLTEGMDKGPILSQTSLELTGKESKQDLADTLLDLGNKLLLKCLSNISLSENVKSMPQNEGEATYTHKVKKSDGIIDWKKTALEIERQIRAYAVWPKSRARINNIDCIIISAEVSETKINPGNIEKTKESLLIGCGVGSLLIKRLQPAGKKPMSANEFIRGYIR